MFPKCCNNSQSDSNCTKLFIDEDGRVLIIACSLICWLMVIQTLNLNLKGHIQDSVSLTFENEVMMISKHCPFLLIFVLKLLSTCKNIVK